MDRLTAIVDRIEALGFPGIAESMRDDLVYPWHHDTTRLLLKDLDTARKSSDDDPDPVVYREADRLIREWAGLRRPKI